MTKEEVETTFANHPYWAYMQGLQDGTAYTLVSFRREAVKDILCAMISTTNGANPKDVTTAIEIADELIKQLREEQK